MTTCDVHFAPLTTIAGLCGWWQVSQGRPEECSAEATCGNHLGFAAFAS